MHKCSNSFRYCSKRGYELNPRYGGWHFRVLTTISKKEVRKYIRDITRTILLDLILKLYGRSGSLWVFSAGGLLPFSCYLVNNFLKYLFGMVGIKILSILLGITRLSWQLISTKWRQNTLASLCQVSKKSECIYFQRFFLSMSYYPNNIMHVRTIYFPFVKMRSCFMVCSMLWKKTVGALRKKKFLVKLYYFRITITLWHYTC